MSVSNDFLLVQDFVKGETYGVEILMHKAEPKAIFVHKRLREYPITGGASTLRVSVKNERLVKYAVKLLKEMGWQGVAMLEFKLDEKSGKVKLIEVNGRFWGSLPLAIYAGVDFPYLLYKAVIEGDVNPVHNYRVGAVHRWLLPGDLLWLFSSLIYNRKNRLHKLLEFLLSFRVPDDVISLDDFLPTFGMIASTLRDFVEVILGRKNIYGGFIA